MPAALAPHHEAALRQALGQAETTPFPAVAAEPDTRYAWEHYQAFLAHAPRRLVTVIDAEYCDPEQQEPYDPDADIDLRLRYEDLFAAAGEVAAALLGETGETEKDPTLFDEEIFNFDDTRVRYWRRAGRIVLLHYAVQWGDGDLQVSVVLCVVPGTRAAS